MNTRRPLSTLQIRNPPGSPAEHLGWGGPLFAIRNFVLLLTLCALPFTIARAQSSTATLTGTVEDQNGAVVPGANITVLDVNTRRQRETTTNDQGYFVVPLLPPTTYKVSIARNGFATVEVENVVLNVGDQKALQIQLKAGDITEMVRITGEAPLINESPAVATTIDRTFVQNLPLNGRSFSSLVLLTPGVTVTAANDTTDSGQFSVNGQRASTNYFTIDGAGANFGMGVSQSGATSTALAGAYPGTSVTGGTSNLVSIEALEEFKIQTSTYTAESGRQPGGQVQVITRSGKNPFHGSLFEYFRNEALDARAYFNKKPEAQNALRQNIYGGTFSGPVLLPAIGDSGAQIYNGRDRTFFFFSYEAQRLLIPRRQSVNVPSERLRALAFAPLRPLLEAFPIPTGPETTNALQVCTPSPNDPSCAPNGRRFTGLAPASYGSGDPSNVDSLGIRIDHLIAKNHTLFGRANESPSNVNSGTVSRFKTVANTRTFTLGLTSVLSGSLLNELRFNWSRYQAQSLVLQSDLGGAMPLPDSAIYTNGLPGSGTVSIRGISLAGGTRADSYQRQMNIVNNLTFTTGKHIVKVGIDFRHLSPLYGTQDSQALFFSTEAGVVNGTANIMSISTSQPSEPRFNNYSLFAQDTWKPMKRMSIDVGFRWELNPPPSEKNGRMPPIVFGDVREDVLNATLAPLGTEFYKTFWTALAPRLGAALILRGPSGWETVARGGFGVYYDLGSGTAAAGWPIVASRSQLPPTSGCPMIFPISAACAARPGIVQVTPANTSLFSFQSPNEDLKLPYSLHWNLTGEQSLGNMQKLTVAYVGSTGQRLLTTLHLNRQPRDLVSGALLPRPNPSFGNIAFSFNGPPSSYNAMQVQYTLRLKDRANALVNYTWSHAIDEVSTDHVTSVGGMLDRGDANFDVRHNASAAVYYNFSPLNLGQFVKWLTGDWSLSAIIFGQTGKPLNVSMSAGNGTFVDLEGETFALRPDRVANVPIYLSDPSVPGGRRFNPAAFASPLECLPVGSPTCVARIVRQGTLGRNALRELPLIQVDLALSRMFRISEQARFQLKAEAFNVFNRPMFGGYNTAFGQSGVTPFGVPTSTLSQRLGGLNSLYQLGGPRSIQLSARLSF